MPDSPATPTPTPCRKDLDSGASPTGRLDALSRVPVAVQAGVLLVLLAVGLWLGGPVGGGLLLVVGAVLVAALGLSWRVMTMPERLLRFALAFLVFAVALVRMFPR